MSDQFKRYALVSTCLDVWNMPSHVILECSSLDEMKTIIESGDESSPFPPSRGFDKVRAVFGLSMYPHVGAGFEHGEIVDGRFWAAPELAPVYLGRFAFAHEGPYAKRALSTYKDDEILCMGEMDGQFSYSVYGIPDVLHMVPADVLLNEPEEGLSMWDGVIHGFDAPEPMPTYVRPKPRNKVASDIKWVHVEKKYVQFGSDEKRLYKKRAKRFDRRDARREIEEQLWA